MGLRRRMEIFVFCIAAIAAAPAVGQELSTPIPHAGHYYASTIECMTWPQASDFAEHQTFRDPQSGHLLAGHLVTITSPEEQEFVFRTFVWEEWSHAWLGAYRLSDDGGVADNWAWVTGEPWEYVWWAPGQPESYDEDRGSIMNYTDGMWHDYDDSYQECGWRYTVVEFEPPRYRCGGFAAPVKDGRLVVAGSRTVPLKVRILDKWGSAITPQQISAPPVLEVYFTPAGGALSDEILVGCGSDDRFVYDGGQWRINLAPAECLQAEGTYRAAVRSGDLSEYTIAAGGEALLEVRPTGLKTVQ